MKKKKNPNNRLLLGSIFCLIILILAGTGLFFFVKNEAAKKELAKTATTTLAIPASVYFANLPIQAASYYIYDVKTGQVVYQKNADTVRPLASLTKLMMGLVSTENLPATTTVTIDQAALNQDGDNGLLLNEKWSFNELLDFSLIVSSNDGAYAIAETYDALYPGHDFVEEMNEEAEKLGLSSMVYYNPNGLDINITQSGGYGSAKDVEKLMQYILMNYPNILEVTKYGTYRFTSSSGIVHGVSNTDTIVNKVPGLFASKTGYTDLAGGNLAIAYDEDIGHPVIMVLLGSTEEGRFSDMTLLASSTRAYLSQPQ